MEIPEVEWQQEHVEVVPTQTWWWAVQITLSAVALIANIVFLITCIYNRKRHELKTFVSAVIITISVLDIIDVLRVLPVLPEYLYGFQVFRHVFCSFGVFHELAVAVFLIAISVAVCCQAGKETKFYQSTRASLAHKILIPIVLLVAGGAAAPFFMLPYDQLSYTCTNPFNASLNLYKGETRPESDKFAIDLYSMIITVFTYVLPILILPLAVPIACLRTCLARQCCVNRFKQPIGELIMVTLIDLIYLGTVVGVVLPQIDAMLKDTKLVSLGSVPLLWELGNTAARPLVYFMTNPAVWDGLQAMCCTNKHQLVVNDDAEETEVPLSPVTTV